MHHSPDLNPSSGCSHHPVPWINLAFRTSASKARSHLKIQTGTIYIYCIFRQCSRFRITHGQLNKCLSPTQKVANVRRFDEFQTLIWFSLSPTFLSPGQAHEITRDYRTTNTWGYSNEQHLTLNRKYYDFHSNEKTDLMFEHIGLFRIITLDIYCFQDVRSQILTATGLLILVSTENLQVAF